MGSARFIFLINFLSGASDFFTFNFIYYYIYFVADVMEMKDCNREK